MKRSDLIVVKVSGDKRLCRIFTRYGLDIPLIHPALVHPACIRVEIPPYRAHGKPISSQQTQVVGNVAGAATKFPAHMRYHK